MVSLRKNVAYVYMHVCVWLSLSDDNNVGVADRVSDLERQQLLLVMMLLPLSDHYIVQQITTSMQFQ